MKDWVEKAPGTQSVEEACDAVDVKVMDYHRGRLEDPVFDQAALVFDQVLDLLVFSSVRSSALKGDVRAQLLYYKVRLPALIPDYPSWKADKEAIAARLSPRRAKAHQAAPGGVEVEVKAEAQPKGIEEHVVAAMVAAGLEATEIRQRKQLPPPPAPAKASGD